MSYSLVVLAILRLSQLLLAGTIFVQAWKLNLSSSIIVFCRSIPTGQISYRLEFPFNSISVKTPDYVGCAPSGPSLSSSTFIDTGFAPAVNLFIILVVLTFVYGSVSIVCYVRQLFFHQKQCWQTLDIFITTFLCILWCVNCYMAIRNFSSLSDSSSPFHVMTFLPVCRQWGASGTLYSSGTAYATRGSYCSPLMTGIFSYTDLGSILSLALLSALTWGVNIGYLLCRPSLSRESANSSVLSDKNRAEFPSSNSSISSASKKSSLIL